jgi:hypothetical protein
VVHKRCEISSSRTNGNQDTPQESMLQVVIVHPLEVQLLGWRFRFSVEIHAVDFTIHVVIHHDVSPLELINLTIILPMPYDVLQDLSFPLYFDIFNPVDVHEFLVSMADGETKTVVALVMWGLICWYWSIHTQCVERISFILSGRRRGATTHFRIAAICALLCLPSFIFCGLPFYMWIGQQIVCAGICGADFHLGQLTSDVVFCNPCLEYRAKFTCKWP